jgi:hypothetical protein
MNPVGIEPSPERHFFQSCAIFQRPADEIEPCARRDS